MRKASILISFALATAIGAGAAYRSFDGAGGDAARGVRATRERTRIAETGALYRFASDAPPKKGGEAAPALSLTASDGTGLKLASLDARGVIQGPLAFTEVRLVFDNPEDRTLEGTFRIALPQGAAISRFAMRQGDRWQEGEVVEKQKARQVYEDFLHRRQDPALLEQAAGNEFSARVFPIPARGRKELIVSYSHELTPESPYVLPLRGLSAVGKLDAVVSRSGDDAPVVGQVHLENAAPQDDLRVDPSRLPPGDGVRAGELALLRVRPAAEAGQDPVASAVVMVDTSASRALGFEAQIEAVSQVLSGLGQAPVVVAAFDQGIDVVYEGPAAGFAQGGAVKLRERQALGASDLGEALEWARKKATDTKSRRVLLVTDGVSTVGAIEPAQLKETVARLKGAGVERLDALAVGGIRDDATLKGMCTAGLARDGMVIDASKGAEQALRRLTSATRTVSVQIEGAEWQWPEKVEGVQPGDEVLVYAKLTEGSAAKVKVGDQVHEAKLVEVDRPLLERAWVSAKINQLVQKPPKDKSEAQVKEEIVKLSTTFRVLSPHTSLLVLEGERDYVQYKIDRKALADILTVDGTKLVRTKRSEDGVAFDTTTLPMKNREPASDGVVLRAPGAPPSPPPVMGGRDEGDGRERDRKQDAPRAKGAAPMAAARADEAPMPGVAATAEARAVAAAPAPQPAPQPAGEPAVGRGTTGASRPSGGGRALADEPALAPGGLGLSGTGEGGGGVGSRPIGAGHVGALGGEALGMGSGHGPGVGGARPAQVRAGAVVVQGRLPTEVIQRIVRQSWGRFRACYENGLRANPELQGRITTQFVIGVDGAVREVSTGGSDLPAPPVVSCVSRAFSQLSFPQPEQGVVRVTFPLQFQPRGASSLPAEVPVAPSPSSAPPKPSFGPYEGELAVVMEHLAKGEREQALAKAMAFRQASPGDVLAFVALGEVFEALGEVRSAARAYGSIVDLFASRADLRRMAGERLERLGAPYAHGLAADSYEKAAQQRPDHPSGHRLLAFARLRAGDHAGAFEAIEGGAKRSYPSGRFRGVDRILREDAGLIGAAWASHEPSMRGAIEGRLGKLGATFERGASVRFVINWETDNNDVDFHVHDATGGHAYYGAKHLPSGGDLYEDVTTGYGPECFTIRLAPEKRAAPYKLQAHYYSRGPMGYGMGKLEIVEHDGQGGLTFEERPFVIMRDRAFVELGTYPAGSVAKGLPKPELPRP